MDPALSDALLSARLACEAVVGSGCRVGGMGLTFWVLGLRASQPLSADGIAIVCLIYVAPSMIVSALGVAIGRALRPGRGQGKTQPEAER